MNPALRLFIRFATLVAIVGVSSCGDSSSCERAPDTPTLIYDEVAQGQLPYTLRDLTPAQLAKVTFGLALGESEIRGTANGGETFIVRVAPGQTIVRMVVRYRNPIQGNSYVSFVFPYPTGSPALVTHIAPMDLPGDYELIIPLPRDGIGGGMYEIYSGTGVSGYPVENPFSVRFTLQCR
jgi:hypothetical protein